jgi:hypothetical protein
MLGTPLGDYHNLSCKVNAIRKNPKNLYEQSIVAYELMRRPLQFPQSLLVCLFLAIDSRSRISVSLRSLNAFFV